MTESIPFMSAKLMRYHSKYIKLVKTMTDEEIKEAYILMNSRGMTDWYDKYRKYPKK